VPARVTFVVMSKFPEPGRVKTRMQPGLSPEQAAGVYREFLLHFLNRLAGMELGGVVLCHDPADAADRFARLLNPRAGVRLLPQATGDLGQRIAAAAKQIGVEPGGPLLFLGVDSPDLPEGHISELAWLLESSDVAVGPSEDGGYWGLGLESGVDAAALLAGIPWSSGREAAATMDRARALNYSLKLGRRWDDVDRVEDLDRLLRRLGNSSRLEDARLLEALSSIVAAPAEVR
jgi:hypothetical protein